MYFFWGIRSKCFSYTELYTKHQINIKKIDKKSYLLHLDPNRRPLDQSNIPPLVPIWVHILSQGKMRFSLTFFQTMHQCQLHPIVYVSSGLWMRISNFNRHFMPWPRLWTISVVVEGIWECAMPSGFAAHLCEHPFS